MENYSSENLDDGELWLPSDIFPVEEPAVVPCNSNKFKNNNSFCCCYSCLLHRNGNGNGQNAVVAAAGGTNESIIQRLAAISLLQQQQQQQHRAESTPKEPFSVTERRFRPVDKCSCTNCSLSECFQRNRTGRGLLRTGPTPVYHNHLYPPAVQHQVESLMEARTRFIQMEEQNRFIRMQRRTLGLNRFDGNRFSPFVGATSGLNGESSSVRDYGGTGVFLPRIPTTNNIDNNGRKIQGGISRQDVHQNGRRYP
ncbi:putative protein isoform X1 [Capsicum annuum]|uniref:uncharacterized protein LOC107846456 isoform X1 n=1 Tax=Capsicum annuum TaxID=4072 RepID=UPI0007BFE6C2|nr:uncharacterized protein LOC107846456 isoform X1 [Capsicum annuum]